MGPGRHPLRDATTATLILSLRSKPHESLIFACSAKAPVAAGSGLHFLSLRSNPPLCLALARTLKAPVAAGSARKSASPL
jgi:hypothetical protein